MAGQSLKHVLGHEHCGVCGACFLQPAQLHKCPEPVRLDILAVFVADSQRVNVFNAQPGVNAPLAGADGKQATASALITEGD